MKGAAWSTFYASPQILSALSGGTMCVDLLANDMWAMGVILVCMLAGHSMFGINREDGPELVDKLRDEQTEWDVAMAKQRQWVSLVSLLHASVRPCRE